MGHLSNGPIKKLQMALKLCFNHLRGALPVELGKVDKLVSLDVSSNQLSGGLPPAFKVSFSNNLFMGPIPTFLPFQKNPHSSFLGNKGLCGEPLSSLIITITAKAAGVEEDVVNNRPTIIAGNVFVENLRQAVDLEAVVMATMKDSNKVYSGTFSTVYKAVMPSGLILAVRRLKSMDRTIIHHQHKMIRELERLSRLCHENLERPIGFVIYEDVALLLHQYLPNGTLAQLLHESTQQPDYEPDWPTRLSIAIGVAEGLAFLHHVAIIHLDISSVNVLLDANFKPLVGEIEISKLLDPSRGTASISAVAGSFGYIPPEYAYTMQVTAPGNVYSYGVVLLEILTTRLPVDDAFGEGVDLVKWVQSAPSRGETPEQILDARLSTVSFGWRKEMLAALKVALLCTDTTSAKRPKMKQVVEMLQEIKQT
ncbi:hypothetical protein UlMin_038463 [Ulmus minor]